MARWQTAVVGGRFDTTLRFEDDREFDVEMTTVSVSGGYSLDERRTVRAAVGVILDGELQRNGGSRHDVKSGALAAVGMEYRAWPGAGARPSVDLSGSLGLSWAQTAAVGSDDEKGYLAADLRVGASAGWSLMQDTYTYLGVRLFGGPVNWELEGEDVTGSDIHHYQLGLGSAAQIGKIGVFAEYFGLGENTLAAGMSARW